MERRGDNIEPERLTPDEPLPLRRLPAQRERTARVLTHLHIRGDHVVQRGRSERRRGRRPGRYRGGGEGELPTEQARGTGATEQPAWAARRWQTSGRMSMVR